MIVSPAAHGLTLGKNAPGYERSPGLHMSEIYNDLYARLEPKRYAKGGPMPMDKMELGMVFEELLEEGLKRRLAADGRPGEFLTQHAPDCVYADSDRITPCPCGAGIAYSPDLILFNGVSRLGEIKLTWMSTRDVPITPSQAASVNRPDLANLDTDDQRGNFPGKFNKWFTQIMAYSYHLHTVDARLIVFFVNGNYKPPSPVVLAWDLHFTQRELDENWAALLNHARAEGKL